MARKRIDESPRRPRGNSTAIRLEEHVSGGGEAKPAREGDEMPNLLIESNPVTMTLHESAGGKVIARGEYGRVGVATQNGRIYPEKLMEREINRLSADLSSRRVLGELDHPTDGKTSLKRVSHVITGLKIKDGIIIGEAEILNTPEGQTLKALIEAKVQIGVSSRGFGSTRPSEDPKMEGDVVQDDFVLKTWDFVADPAVKTAIPGIFTEDVDENQPDIAEMFLAEFPDIASKLQEDALDRAKLKVNKGVEEAVKEAEDRVRAELSEKFEKGLAEAIVDAKEQLSEELREEFESDPEIGGAKAALSAIWEMVAPFRATDDEVALADAEKARELEVSEAKDAAVQAEDRAVQAECMAYIEREINGHPMAESIRGLVKKAKFDGLDDAKEKLAAILSDLPERTDENFVSREEAELREENAAMKEKVSLLSERVNSLDSKLRRAVEVGDELDAQRVDAEARAHELEEQLKETSSKVDSMKGQLEEADKMLELEAYKRDKVAGMPNGRELSSLLEDITSKDKVDELVAKRGYREVSSQELAEARKTLARGAGERQEEERPLAEGTVSTRPTSDDLGNDMSFMKRLAGVGE